MCVEVVEEATCNVGGPRFYPYVGKVPWRREWQSTPVFLPEEFHGWRRLVGHSLWGCKEPDMTDRVTCSQHTEIILRIEKLLISKGKEHIFIDYVL